MDVDARRAEVRANYQAFEETLPSLLPQHRNRFAALRHRQLIDAFDSFDAALTYCAEAFPDQGYSIQEITDEPLTSGSATYAFGRR